MRSIRQRRKSKSRIPPSHTIQSHNEGQKVGEGGECAPDWHQANDAHNAAEAKATETYPAAGKESSEKYVATHIMESLRHRVTRTLSSTRKQPQTLKMHLILQQHRRRRTNSLESLRGRKLRPSRSIWELFNVAKSETVEASREDGRGGVKKG